MIEIKQDKLRHDRQDVIWYDGEIATIENENFKLSLNALGEIRFNYGDNGYYKERIVYKGGNHERFISEIENIFKNDDNFYEMIHNDDLIFESNNWFEIFVETNDGDPYAYFVADAVDYDTAILELKTMYNFYLQEGLSNA